MSLRHCALTISVQPTIVAPQFIRLPHIWPFMSSSSLCRNWYCLVTSVKDMDLLLWWCYGVLGVLTYLVLFYALEPLQRRLRRLPPGPRGLPLFGNLLQIGSKPNESLQILAKKYGPIMSLFLGMKTVVVISSPDMAKEVLKIHDKNFAGRDVIEASKVMDHGKKAMIFGQPGPHWRLLRRISTTELFSAKKLTDLRYQICQTVNQVNQKADGKSSIDVRDISLRCTLNLLGKMVFSTDMFDANSETFAEFKDCMAKLSDRSGSPNMVDYFPILRPLDPQRVLRDTHLYMKRGYDMIDSLIHNRLKCPHSDTTQNDFLDTLIKLADSEFTLSDIRVLLTDLFGAGSHSTMITVEWAMTELIRHPSVMAKAQLELDEVVGRERIVGEDDFESLPYLRAVVKETLRLHPPAPLLVPHRAEQHCEVAGFLIPKNTVVMVNFWGIARDPCVWHEPQKFMPARFAENSIDYKGQHFEFIPFGAGRRMCVGLPLATRMLHSLLGALIQCFEWELPIGVEEVDMGDKCGVTLHKTSPLIAVAKSRLPACAYRKE